MEREEKRRKENRKYEKGKIGHKRREEEREEKKRGIFPAFRRSNPDSLKVKVGPRNEGYTWVPKFGSFVKLQNVGNLPTWIIASIKAI